MFFIAQRFEVSLDALIAANPHISNPNLIFPCDVLCVPDSWEEVIVTEDEE
jgi:LysM repeat protein